MDRLEQELQQALTRKDPSPGFADRVIAASSIGRVVIRPAPRRPAVRPWLALAATVVLMLAGGIGWRHHRGEVARQRVMTAMRITAVRLNRIQTRVREVRP